MKINSEDMFISKQVGELSDQELTTMYADIIEFHKTGVLRQMSQVRDLARIFAVEMHMDIGSIRLVEEAVLYEMARRYNNLLEDEHQSEIEGWLVMQKGKGEALLMKRMPDSRMRGAYQLITADKPGLLLGEFDSVDAAKKFAEEKKFKIVQR